ncbi:MAG: lysophospholipid acyltransferase family protein [Coriobacteriia bacterium]
MLYRLAWLLFNIPLRLAFRLRFVGRGRLPSRGPVVVSGNHLSYLDPILLALATWRPIHYMAKVELFEGNRAFAWLLRHVHAFPVRRGTADREALTRAQEILDAGGIVGIFPEGTRSSDGSLGEVYGGAALVAIRSGATLVPVGIAGTEEVLPRGSRRLRFAPVVMAFGEPVTPDRALAGSRKERVASLTGMLMEELEIAVEEARALRAGTGGGSPG